MKKIKLSYKIKYTLLIFFIILFFVIFLINFTTDIKLKENTTKKIKNALNTAVLYKMEDINKNIIATSKEFSKVYSSNEITYENIKLILKIFNKTQTDSYGIGFAGTKINKNLSYYIYKKTKTQSNLIKINKFEKKVYKRDYLNSIWFKKERISKKRMYSNIYKSPFGNTFLISYYSPIYKNNYYQGTLINDINLSFLGTLLRKNIRKNKYLNIYFAFNNNIYSVLKNGNLIKIKQITVNKKLLKKLNILMKNSKRENKLVNNNVNMTYTSFFNGKLGIIISFNQTQLMLKIKQWYVKVFIIYLLILLILFFMIYKIITSFSNPIIDLANDVQELLDRGFSKPLKTRSNSYEINFLKSSINIMRRDIKRYITQVEQKVAIERDIEIASILQKNLLPTKDEFSKVIFDGIELKTCFIPSKIIGGDLFDYRIKNNILFSCIGDVCGKGIPASILSSATLCFERILAGNHNDLICFVNQLNTEINKINFHMHFVTFFVSTLDCKSGRLDYINAGHNLPLIIKKDGIVRELDNTQGTVLGIYDNFKFEKKTVYLETGDHLFLYTDGIIEAENGEEILYGKEKLIQKLKLLVNNSNVLQKICRDVVNYCEISKRDDITMLLISKK